MSRFYGTVTNSRGNSAKACMPSSGGESHTRGWDAGVKVVTVDNDGKDEFRVYMTHGSNGSGRDVLVGIVKDTPEGPVFDFKLPAEVKS